MGKVSKRGGSRLYRTKGPFNGGLGGLSES